MNLLHCFQNTIPIKNKKIEKDLQEITGLKAIEDNECEVNFITAVKHLNNKKIDSHLYFFRGFCEYLEPEFCMLVDIGTKPLA
jgi:chitin synthase